jgi:hypothetical protein
MTVGKMHYLSLHVSENIFFTEEFYLVEYNTMLSCEIQPTFRGTITSIFRVEK